MFDRAWYRETHLSQDASSSGSRLASLSIYRKVCEAERTTPLQIHVQPWCVAICFPHPTGSQNHKLASRAAQVKLRINVTLLTWSTGSSPAVIAPTSLQGTRGGDRSHSCGYAKQRFGRSLGGSITFSSIPRDQAQKHFIQPVGALRGRETADGRNGISAA